ncbi:MAG: hypothetical protein KZQ89_15610 [Candidatus Thiodiazotropha sp. (ex Lucinoma kastoroae)]|nr:hypothetical protein [Candidatus Thiodiazotropha sp. (ex Lucinoma kastoroae)]
MRISIRHNSDYIVEYDQLSINGREAAGGYAFNFVLNGSRQARESPMSVFSISLSLSLSSPVKQIITYIPSSTQVVQCHNFPNNSEQLHFEAVFTKEQINAIEEHRREKDLTLNIGLRALTALGDTVWPSFDCTDVTVPREHWLGALNNSGFRQTLLFEVPLPSVSDELIALLSKAQEFIEMGHYKDAVMQCRHIIEHVETIRGDKNLSIAANQKAQTRQEREVMTAIERMLSLREQFKNICHLGAHGSEYFTRTQAKAVLGMTMALLAEPTVGFTKVT